MADAATTLLKLARARFDDLTEAEERMLTAAANGTGANCTDLGGGYDPHDEEDEWPKGRTIRAEMIRWLCVDKAALGRVDPKGVQIEGASIENEIDLRFVHTPFPLALLGCRVPGNIDLLLAHLPTLNLSRSQCGSITADSSTFSGNVYLRRTHTTGQVRFNRSVIGGDLSCHGAHFNPFSRLKKKCLALCADGAKIGGVVVLRNVTAEGDISFLGSQIDDGFSFRGTKVKNGDVTLQKSKIGGHFWWDNSYIVDGTLDLSYCHVNLMTDGPESWPQKGKLILYGFTYYAISAATSIDSDSRKDWLSRQLRTPFHPQPYTQLAEMYRREGDENASREILVERETLLTEYGKFLPLTRLWRRFIGITIGYGYRPFRALWLSILVIWLGTCVFLDGFVTNQFMPANPRTLIFYQEEKKLPDGYPEFNALIYAADTFFPIVDLHQERFWLPNGQQRCFLTETGVPCSWFYRGFLWAHIAAGWILTTLFVAGISGLVKKE